MGSPPDSDGLLSRSPITRKDIVFNPTKLNHYHEDHADAVIPYPPQHFTDSYQGYNIEATTPSSIAPLSGTNQSLLSSRTDDDDRKGMSRLYTMNA
jgi:hypothetical protein